MTEDYTPSIHIEPPPESDEHALFASLGVFDNSYCPPSEADHCYPQAPTLFIQPSEPLHISTELSPLDEFLAPNLAFSPCTSGRSSPVGAWSPVSSFSGDVFPDDLSQEELSWNAHSAHSSPAHSPSSLSPLTVAFDGVGLEDSYPGVDRTILNGPPAFSRLRSSSQSMPSAAPSEMWAEGVGRGRSSSFSGSTNTDTQFYAFPENTAAVEVQVPSVDVTYSDPLGTSMSWGSEASAEGPSTVNVVGEHLTTLGTLATGWKYPNRESSSTDSEDRAPPSPSLLTVPNVSLRRRPACSSRRTVSHSDLNSLMPPDADVGRGRGQHRTTLSIPNSRSVSSGSRTSSRDVSPHSLFDGYSSPSSLYSPGSASPSSPAFEDADADDEREGGAVSVGRRRTFAAIRETDEYLPSVSALSRAASAPTRARRSRSSTSALPANIGLGVFKAERTDTASFLSASPGDGDISRQEFRFPTQSPAHPAFKAEVASNKIRQASNARRLNVAAFVCPLETCSSTFTARHNLINHINSHNKYRPHKCPCGMSFTTQGVLNRHKKRCRK